MITVLHVAGRVWTLIALAALVYAARLIWRDAHAEQDAEIIELPTARDLRLYDWARDGL